MSKALGQRLIATIKYYGLIANVVIQLMRLLERLKMKTKEVIYLGVTYTVKYKEKSNSFTHAFGTRVLSQNELYSVMVDNIDITDIIKQDVLEKFQDAINQ